MEITISLIALILCWIWIESIVILSTINNNETIEEAFNRTLKLMPKGYLIAIVNNVSKNQNKKT